MMQMEKHANHTAQEKNWARCRLAMRSAQEIKASESAIPRLVTMERREADSETATASKDRRYKMYTENSKWCGSPKRTMNGFIGLVMRKPAEVLCGGESGKSVDWLKDVDGSRTHVNNWVEKNVLPNVFTVGCHGVLIDQPKNVNEPSPRLISYPAESVVNWKEEDGKLTWVALKEEFEEIDLNFGDTLDIKPKKIDQTRHLVLEDGRYQWYIYDEQNKLKDSSHNYRTASTRELDFIPFQMISYAGSGFCHPEPPLLELIELCYDDLKLWALCGLANFFGASPAYIARNVNYDRMKKLGVSLSLGQMGIIGLPEAGQVNIVEYTGAIIGHYMAQLEMNRRAKIALGAAILSTEGVANIAKDTAKGISNSDQSMLTQIVNNISEGVQKVLKMVLRWLGTEPTEENCNYQLNKEFWDETLTGELASSLVGLWTDNLMTREDIYHNLSRVKGIKPGVGEKEWLEQLDARDAERLDLEKQMAQFAANLTAQPDDDDDEEDDDE